MGAVAGIWLFFCVVVVVVVGALVGVRVIAGAAVRLGVTFIVVGAAFVLQREAAAESGISGCGSRRAPRH